MSVSCDVIILYRFGCPILGLIHGFAGEAYQTHVACYDRSVWELFGGITSLS